MKQLKQLEVVKGVKVICIVDKNITGKTVNIIFNAASIFNYTNIADCTE